MKRILLYSCIICFAFGGKAYSQFKLSGQILNRSEYRHGFGSLVDEGVKPNFSIGQRTRLNANYSAEKVKFGMALQDIRAWGNTPQTKISDGFFSVHEAWMDILFSSKFSAKIGRQELDYDNARFLGNLDWALQARAHDIAVFKFNDSLSQFQMHGALAFNQTSNDNLTGTYYGLQNQYKIAQMLWINKKWDKFQIGFLFWNNGMQSDTTITHNLNKVNYTSTLSVPVIEFKENNWTVKGFFYYQFGLDQKNRRVNAYDANAEINFSKRLNENKQNNISVTGGFEYLSGTSQFNQSADINNSFNPLYGTNHKFNGYMDYFYASGRHLNSVGLMDSYVTTKYDFNPKIFIGGSFHFFNTAASVKTANFGKANPYLGTEIDLVAGYKFVDALSFQAGYSQMLATSTLEILKGGNAKATQNWFYLALLFRPGMKNKFVGLNW